jgi:hypothetical protein
MQIEDVFGAVPKSVLQYLCENGQGLYVPAYQRQYSWDKSKIERLIEDICHGFSMLISHKDAITFLGTLIAIHDTQYLTVNPLVRGDVPSRVMTIIDGQQRITTLLLINTVLHDSIRTRASAIKNAQEVEKVWLFEECMKVAGLLAKTFEEDKDYGDGPFRYYPRMIRAYDDSWSRKKDKAEYKSPIGRYLHLYGQHCRDKEDKVFKFELPPEAADHPKHRKLGDGRKAVQTMLTSLASGDKELELPTFSSMVGSKSFQEILVKAEFPEEVRGLVLAEGNDPYKDLLRLVLFANFVLSRVALTTVTAKNEDYAFDMFESLNTTGEPLTAFETFKPRVIHFEGLENYEKTKSYEYMQAAEAYLEGFTKTDDKQDATSRLIVAFASAERGEKLSKRLSDQRRFFKECFDRFDDDAKREFVRHLSHCALFVQNSWPDGQSSEPSLHSAKEAATDEVMLCLDAMRAIKHSIILGPLVRFYSEIQKADAKGCKKAIDEFISAAKAIAAFSTLWRASRRGTDNIDMHYRNLMSQGCSAVGMSPLCRVAANGQGNAPPSSELLKAALRHVLKVDGSIESKEDWVKAAARLPAYQNQRDITRLVLLAAAHDSAVDKAEPGLTVQGKADLLPMLNFKRWRDEASQTVEHIAPATASDGWEEKLYEDDEVIHRLGNLTLLPQSANSSLSNGSWEKKRLIYKVLSAETADELDPLIKQAKAQGLEISKSTAELLAESKHLPMVKAVASVDGSWTLDLLDKRSIRIAELAWGRFAPWLGFAA